MNVNRTWLIRFSALTGAAVVLGLLASFGVGQLLEVPTAPTSSASGPEVVAATPSAPTGGVDASDTPSALTEAQYLSSILGRHLFDYTKIGVDAPVGEGDGGEDGAKLSSLNVRLTGTVVAIPASASAAFIAEEKAASSPRAYGIGQLVQGAEIVEIYERKVKLRRNNEFEWLLLDEEKEVTTASRTTESVSAPTEDVEQKSDTEFVVSRAMLDEALSDLDALAKMGRALMHRGPDGEIDGYRLSAIRRGTLADKLGIRNGDVVHSVNGMPLTSMQGAMSALQSLQSESNLKFEVTRRGQPVDMSYEVR